MARSQYCRPTSLLEPPSRQLQKAIATLNRSPDDPRIYAMSGYTQAECLNLLNNQIWTNRAERLQVLLGLPRDRGFACLVEAQLLTYILYRHTLDMLEDKDQHEVLASVKPAYSLRPTITVSKTYLCRSCSSLLERFKQRSPSLNVYRLIAWEIWLRILH